MKRNKQSKIKKAGVHIYFIKAVSRN